MVPPSTQAIVSCCRALLPPVSKECSTDSRCVCGALDEAIREIAAPPWNIRRARQTRSALSTTSYRRGAFQGSGQLDTIQVEQEDSSNQLDDSNDGYKLRRLGGQ